MWQAPCVIMFLSGQLVVVVDIVISIYWEKIFHRIGKGQFSFQSQRKAMPTNAQTTTQLHSSHTLVK